MKKKILLFLSIFTFVITSFMTIGLQAACTTDTSSNPYNPWNCSDDMCWMDGRAGDECNGEDGESD